MTDESRASGLGLGNVTQDSNVTQSKDRIIDSELRRSNLIYALECFADKYKSDPNLFPSRPNPLALGHELSAKAIHPEDF